MKAWIDGEIATLLRLIRRPGVAMMFAGFVIGGVWLELAFYCPWLPSDSPLVPPFFWLGEGLFWTGLARFVWSEAPAALGWLRSRYAATA